MNDPAFYDNDLLHGFVPRPLQLPAVESVLESANEVDEAPTPDFTPNHLDSANFDDGGDEPSSESDYDETAAISWEHGENAGTGDVAESNNDGTPLLQANNQASLSAGQPISALSSMATSSQHYCTMCWRSFPLRSTWKRHMDTIHTFQEPYKCTLNGCHREFSRKDILQRHKSNQHGVSKIQCLSCGAFLRKDALRKHQESTRCQRIASLRLDATHSPSGTQIESARSQPRKYFHTTDHLPLIRKDHTSLHNEIEDLSLDRIPIRSWLQGNIDPVAKDHQDTGYVKAQTTGTLLGHPSLSRSEKHLRSPHADFDDIITAMTNKRYSELPHQAKDPLEVIFVSELLGDLDLLEQ